MVKFCRCGKLDAEGCLRSIRVAVIVRDSNGGRHESKRQRRNHIPPALDLDPLTRVAARADVRVAMLSQQEVILQPIVHFAAYSSATRGLWSH